MRKNTALLQERLTVEHKCWNFSNNKFRIM